MNSESICNCPKCANRILITREEALKWQPKRCEYCLDIVIPYINSNNEITVVQKNEHIKDEQVAKCNCPKCNKGLLFTKEEAILQKPKRCEYCLDIVIPYINEKNEIAVIQSKKHIIGEQYAKCSCPICANDMLITRRDAEEEKAGICSHCLNIVVPYINSNGEISLVQKNEHISGEKVAKCNCPVCNNGILFTRDDAMTNQPKKCKYCLNVIVPFVNDNNEIEVYSEDLDNHRTR